MCSAARMFAAAPYRLLVLLCITNAVVAAPVRTARRGSASASAQVSSNDTTINWTVEPSEASATTTRRLVSFNFDWHPPDEGPTWGQNASVLTIDLSNKRLRALAAAMGEVGAVLRIGGSEGDDAVYDIDGACARTRGGSGVPDPAYCLTMPRWQEVLRFASDSGLDVAFGLNVMYGRNCTKRCSPQPCGAAIEGACSAWDPSNALALMEYTAKHGLKVGGFEVGALPSAQSTMPPPSAHPTAGVWRGQPCGLVPRECPTPPRTRCAVTVPAVCN